MSLQDSRRITAETILYKTLIVAQHYDAAWLIAELLGLPRSAWRYVDNQHALRGCGPPYWSLVVEAGWMGPKTTQAMHDLIEGIWTWESRYPGTIRRIDLDAELKKAAKYA